MWSFIIKQKKNNMQLILDRLQLQEELQKEQWNIQREEFQKLLTRQRKSETMLENILETLEEYKNALEEQNAARNKEKILVKYINSYDGSLHQMERMLCEAGREDSEWLEQLHRMREQLCDSLKESELILIKDRDIPVDLTLHEVLGICETNRREGHNRVCEVITPGISFQGKVLYKAKVTVYQYKEEATE